MHSDAYRFIAETIGRPSRVLEIGSLDINGSPRALVLDCEWYGIDMQAGTAVDEIADAASWRSDRRFDLVVCAEVLEHTNSVYDLLVTAAHHLEPEGRLIVTCATDGRAPHSAVDGGPVRAGEFYENVGPEYLLTCARAAGFAPLRFETHHERGDLYLLAVKHDG
jgi:cyclopropane fatty-acyl-phospholipid synthase-like methyltransferase